MCSIGGGSGAAFFSASAAPLFVPSVAVLEGEPVGLLLAVSDLLESLSAWGFLSGTVLFGATGLDVEDVDMPELGGFAGESALACFTVLGGAFGIGIRGCLVDDSLAGGLVVSFLAVSISPAPESDGGRRAKT